MSAGLRRVATLPGEIFGIFFTKMANERFFAFTLTARSTSYGLVS